MEKDLAEKLLDEDWYQNVSNAVAFAMENLPYSTDVEKVFESIIDYNIKKRVHDYIVKNGTKTLRRKLNWKNKSHNDAFVEYKDIIDTCDICESFRSFTFYIDFGEKSGHLQNLFLIWREMTNSYYPGLKVFSKQTNNVYKVVIKKWKSN